MTDLVPCSAVTALTVESAGECPAFAPDPSARLTGAFTAIAARMEGLDFVNPALRVEAVGFAPWEAHWLGVMVTPWFVNLMLVPRDTASWVPLGQGETRRYRFPAGDYDFIGAHDATIGDYQMCSLISPPEFADHESARLVAQLVREALFDPANAEQAAREPKSTQIDQKQAPVSKRDFLRGRFLSADVARPPE